MNEEIRNVLDEQVTTIGDQLSNAASALAKGDTAKLEKALSIIEKVARVLLVVIGAINGAKGAAKGK